MHFSVSNRWKGAVAETVVKNYRVCKIKEAREEGRGKWGTTAAPSTMLRGRRSWGWGCCLFRSILAMFWALATCSVAFYPKADRGCCLLASCYCNLGAATMRRIRHAAVAVDFATTTAAVCLYDALFEAAARRASHGRTRRVLLFNTTTSSSLSPSLHCSLRPRLDQRRSYWMPKSHPI